MKYFFLNIYDYKVSIKTDSKELGERLKRDFYHFLEEEESNSFNLQIHSFLKKPINVYGKKILKTKNSIIYKYKKERINDYYGKLVSVFNYQREEGFLYSEDINKLHEVTYLLILSRNGKFLDCRGFHKIHAASFIYKGICFVGMMKMNTGKSTLFAHGFKNDDVFLISDDTPLLSSGKINPFPMRLGFSKVPPFFLNAGDCLYEIKRDFYGVKKLISVEYLGNKIGREYQEIFLFEGIRGSTREPRIRKGSKFEAAKALSYHMVIGFGLPIIFEYFWETGVRDFFVKVNIAFKRFRAMVDLLVFEDFYIFEMSENPEENWFTLKNYFKNLKWK